MNSNIKFILCYFLFIRRWISWLSLGCYFPLCIVTRRDKRYGREHHLKINTFVFTFRFMYWHIILQIEKYIFIYCCIIYNKDTRYNFDLKLDNLVLTFIAWDNKKLFDQFIWELRGAEYHLETSEWNLELI